MAVFALFLAAAALTIKHDGAELRENCEPSDPVVARLAAGTPATIRFGLNGCYAVEVSHDGRKLAGYVIGGHLEGIEAWEQARRAAPAVSALRNTQRSQPAAAGAHPLTVASQLLADHRPGEALEVAERALMATPRDPQALALAGIAAHRNDMTVRAIGYLKDSLSVRPDPMVQRVLDLALRESAADKSAQQLHSTRFSLRYDTRIMPAATARVLLEVLEQEYTRISFELGCKTAERIAVIAQTREDYRGATGAAEWSAGQYDGRIRVALWENDPGGAMARRVLAHEIVHACLAATGMWPAWLHEGLAQRLSGETLNDAARARIRAAARAKGLPRLENLSQSWSRMSAGHAALAYATAHYAVELFFEHHKEYGIRNLIRNPDQLARIAADLDARIRE